MRRNSLGDSGQSAVEFALAFPLILLMAMFGVQLILLLGDKLAIESAAFDAVRSAAVKFNKDSSDARRTADSIVADRTRMLPIGPGFMRGPVTVKALGISGDEIQLTAIGTAELLPFVRQGAAALGLNETVTITTTASAKVEPFAGE